MRLLIVRHADPDYSIDSLTPTGWKEAALLAERLAAPKEGLEQAYFYVSPLGRAQDTASLTLKKLKKTAMTCSWLREFAPQAVHPGKDSGHCLWDWLPEAWVQEPAYFDREHWADTELFKKAGARDEYQWVIREFDRILAEHGYTRDGLLYRALTPNEDTLVFFCHFGVECVLLSHLIHVSPMQLWHGLCAAPSSVTTLYTEERRPGVAAFRMSAFGDTSHLYAGGRTPSFAARFCETWTRTDQRHD